MHNKVSPTKPFFFIEGTVKTYAYLDMLQLFFNSSVARISIWRDFSAGWRIRRLSVGNMCIFWRNITRVMDRSGRTTVGLHTLLTWTHFTLSCGVMSKIRHPPWEILKHWRAATFAIIPLGISTKHMDRMEFSSRWGSAPLKVRTWRFTDDLT